MPASQTEIALFPIPELVSFPGTVVPLHVFEPRYRRLIDESVAAGRLVGVCNTRKVISAARPNQSIEEALNSNQATYQPFDVFSAGECDVIERSADGRILANIHMQERFSIVEELQALPYRIALCEPYRDLSAAADPEARNLQALVYARLVELLNGRSPGAEKTLADEGWDELSAAAFSFKVFSILRLDPDTLQLVLETRDASDRLKTIWEAVRHG